MLKTAFAICVLAMVARTATAREYFIQLDGYCDKLKLHVSRHASFGASVGKLHGAPCDNSALSGTPAYAGGDVSPNGRIVAEGGDLGDEPAQFMIYVNLSNGAYTLYSTLDGKAASLISGTWSYIGQDADPEGERGLPNIVSAMSRHAGVPSGTHR